MALLIFLLAFFAPPVSAIPRFASEVPGFDLCRTVAEEMAWVEAVKAKMKEEADRPREPYFDPAADPASGASFRGKGIRGALDPEELLASLPTADREVVRRAYESKEINLNQLFELQFIVSVKRSTAREMLEQYREEREEFGAPLPATLTEIPAGMREKILTGEVKLDMSREVRGAHSAAILNKPDEYQIVSEITNPNKTIKVKFKKWIVTEAFPQGTWSKNKSSTLAPREWNEEDINLATRVTIAQGGHVKSEDRPTGRVTFLRKVVTRADHPLEPGIEWEVVVTDENRVISSYPTGN